MYETQWFLVDVVNGPQGPGPYGPNGPFEEYPLSLGENLIGRRVGSNICTNSIYSSRRHCVIEVYRYHDQNITIVDLSSSNGTYLNDEKIQTRQRVNITAGDIIGIGICSDDMLENQYYKFRVCKRVYNNARPSFPITEMLNLKIC